MSYVQFGSYKHASAEAAIQPIGRQAIINDAGVTYGWRWQWRLTGYLQAATPSALQTAITALEAAYSPGPTVPNSDLWLYNDDGSKTPHGINASSTLAGIRVTGFRYPIGNGTQLVNGRDYEIDLEYETYTQQTGLLMWTESVSYHGGGPKIVFKEPLILLPQKQIVKAATTYYAEQRGAAVGLYGYPSQAPPGPIWPGDLLEQYPERQATGGKRRGNKFIEWHISWTYKFASATPFFGFPNLWPN